MTHLEKLIYEYYDWQGYLVKSNQKVGKLKDGGWSMELDIIAYHPTEDSLLHIEPSLDAQKWSEREKRFRKKFDAGQKYIIPEIFPWLEGKDIEPTQYAILITEPKDRTKVGGGTIRSIENFCEEVRDQMIDQDKLRLNAVPEQYPLLRTVQLFFNGYSRIPRDPEQQNGHQ